MTRVFQVVAKAIKHPAVKAKVVKYVTVALHAVLTAVVKDVAKQPR